MDVRSKNPSVGQLVAATKQALAPIEEEILCPLGQVTAVQHSAHNAKLGTVVRAMGNVQLPRVTPKEASQSVTVRAELGSTVSVIPARGGKINCITGGLSLAAGMWGIFLVTADGPDQWLGMIIT